MLKVSLSSSPPGSPVDVAIIGGGAAGTYAAYRLLKADPETSPTLKRLLQAGEKTKLDVRLFEKSDRIGGRLWSYHFPQMPNLTAEIGGIGFNRLQQNVYGLCTQELGLSLVPCTDFDPRIQYLRGRRFPFEQYQDPDVVPYFLAEDERGKDPYTLANEALEKQIPGLTGQIQTIVQLLCQAKMAEATRTMQELALSLRATSIRESTGFSQKPLYKTGLWNLLAENLSIEGYNLATDGGGYFSYFRNWNLYDAMLDLLNVTFFVPDCAQELRLHHKLQHGYDELPRTLAQKLVELGGTVQMQTQLFGLGLEEHNGELLVALVMGTPGLSTRSVLYARSVILALPQRALELLEPDSFIFESAQFRSDLPAVTPSPASKLFLCYDRPWWEEIQYNGAPLTSGLSTTDLPLRTCYYLGQENNHGLLLASFSDDVMTQYWDGYLHSSGLGPHHAPFLGQYGGHIQQSLLTSQDMIVEVQRQLKELHGVNIPEPSAAIYHDWGDEPFGGGWHNWNPHVRSWETIPRMRQPIPGIYLFIAGEAYSSQQGWVEGALNSTEKILQTNFDLPRPAWVRPEYDFGP